MSYGYVPQYVTEEPELSESDCPSEMLQHDVTELYRRKRQGRTFAGSYCQGYFEHPGGRAPLPCPCNLPFDPRYYYYKTAPQSQDAAVFRSSTHLTAPANARLDAKSAAVKKYPVTARTPRYYRCSPVPLCKRPSTLCLPVTCQPDPAVHRARHFRTPEVAAAYDYVTRTAAKRTPEVRAVDSEGDVNSRLNDLENLLTKFENEEDEQRRGEEGGAGEEERGGGGESEELGGVSEISKILKPKVPPSIKAKQVVKLKVGKGNAEVGVQNVSKLEVKEAPDEPLDILLQRLSKETKRKEEEQVVSPKNKFAEGAQRYRHGIYGEQKPPLDDNSAIELHKSKSYIVSLIDKALSKELGTIPGDKCTRKEFLNMNPKRAIELVNRHAAPRMFTTKTVINDVTQSTSSKKDSYECKSEEPLYLKQLKQLRWSHLRHIQREAKRLADLERFLDTFGEIDSPP